MNEMELNTHNSSSISETVQSNLNASFEKFVIARSFGTSFFPMTPLTMTELHQPIFDCSLA